jgi:predicted nuclease of predicted toxin-antitoxin system
MQLLLDEHVSPTLVGRLAVLGVYAQAVPHVGLSGAPDVAIWEYALAHDFVVVTINASHFIELLDVELHPGLVVLRQGGLTREEQWAWIEPVVQHVLATGDRDYLTNKLVEVTGVGKFVIRDIPAR